MDKKFQGGIGLAVAIVLFEVLEKAFGYTPEEAMVIGAVAYILGFVAKQLGIKVED